MKRGKFLCGLLFAVLVTSPVSGSDPFSEKSVPPVPDIQLTGKLDKQILDELIAYGEVLFAARFTSEDGVGRPMATQAIIPTKRRQPLENTFFRTAGLDAGSCAACHNQPKVGGAGDFVTNVFVSEGFESADFDNLDPQFSNERGTNHLFGAGLIELLAREMTADLQSQRKDALKAARKTGQSVEATLSTKGVKFGKVTAHSDGMLDLSKIDGVDSDLVVRPFSQKGVMTSLRQFTVNALNHHHGIQPDERFGVRWTGEDDFDEDGKANEFNIAQVSAVTAWQATLEPPEQLKPDNAAWRAAAERGSAKFDEIGCNTCHIRALPLDSLQFADPGPYDVAGTLRTGDVSEPAVYDLELRKWINQLERNDKGQVMVPLFGDLKRHVIADHQVAHYGNELLAQRFVGRNVFQTTELWGVASTAPYGHRNDLTTLDEAIRAHGGAARKSRDVYVKMEEQDRRDLIAFLKTLVIK